MILEIDEVSFSYKSVDVLRDIKFSLNKGEILAILGNNGAGKSTLLKCINKILRVKKGTILIKGKDVNTLKLKDVAKLVGYVDQRVEVNLNITVFDMVLMGRKPYIKWDVSQKDISIVKEILKRLDLDKISLKNINELSGGELQKVIIARALVQEPEILLLDEPTNSLDLKNQIEVLNIVKEEVRKQNISAIIVLHDINLALRFSDKFVLLKDGTIYSYGNIESINEKVLEEVYGIPVLLEKVRDKFVVIPV